MSQQLAYDPAQDGQRQTPTLCAWESEKVVVWNIFYVPFLVGMMIQSDELIFFRWVGQPPASNDY